MKSTRFEQESLFFRKHYEKMCKCEWHQRRKNLDLQSKRKEQLEIKKDVASSRWLRLVIFILQLH